jgi:hypothetical protein
MGLYDQGLVGPFSLGDVESVRELRELAAQSDTVFESCIGGDRFRKLTRRGVECATVASEVAGYLPGGLRPMWPAALRSFPGRCPEGLQPSVQPMHADAT